MFSHLEVLKFGTKLRPLLPGTRYATLTAIIVYIQQAVALYSKVIVYKVLTYVYFESLNYWHFSKLSLKSFKVQLYLHLHLIFLSMFLHPNQYVNCVNHQIVFIGFSAQQKTKMKMKCDSKTFNNDE